MDKNKDTIICRCEEVTLKDLIETVETHQCSSRELKLRTRAGMGYCGGRTCRYLIDQIYGAVNHDSISDEIPLGYRPPVRPIPFKVMGGRDQ